MSTDRFRFLSAEAGPARPAGRSAPTGQSGLLVPTITLETPGTDLVERSVFANSQKDAPFILPHIRLKRKQLQPGWVKLLGNAA
ncbi:hypothetical protein ACFVVQ_09120 [Paenibacillus chitinolyticus]|uniref:hypothetical protein n=1 Tax=Paenibacillus chitinolyticus TaxID=79263 RepID=UPI0036DF2D31